MSDRREARKMTNRSQRKETKQMSIKALSPAQRDTVLAALRLWQNHIADITGEQKQIPLAELAEIATNSGNHQPLTYEEVDQLCCDLNT